MNAPVSPAVMLDLIAKEQDRRRASASSAGSMPTT